MQTARLWSDWADAQADLSLRWAHSPIIGFVMRRLIWACGSSTPRLFNYRIDYTGTAILWHSFIHSDSCIQRCFINIHFTHWQLSNGMPHPRMLHVYHPYAIGPRSRCCFNVILAPLIYINPSSIIHFTVLLFFFFYFKFIYLHKMSTRAWGSIDR